MKDIRTVAMLYHGYDKMRDMMETILYVIQRQSTINSKFRNMVVDMTEKLYVSYLKASDTYREMQETNPNWLEQVAEANAESFKEEQSVDSLLSDIEMYATVYCQRRKFWEMFNIMFAAEKEANVSPSYCSTFHPMREEMCIFYLDALFMCQEKKEKLVKLGTSPEIHFDEKLLHILNDVDKDVHDYMTA